VRVVVTGGAGYIGSVVTETLIEHGHEALVVDNLSKGHRDAVAGDARFAPLDLKDGAQLVAELRGFGAEAIVHLAADSLVGESMTAPSKYYRNNFIAGLTLLDAMREAGVDRLVFSSTAAVYGEPDEQPITERTATRPTNPYGETKLAFEHALKWYARAYGLSSISLRYFNAAGATKRCGERHSPETHLIPLVLRAAAHASSPVTLFGDDYATRDGTCVRDYIHVSDLAHAHVLALDGLSERSLCDAYNLGCGGAGYTVLEVIKSAERVTGRQVPYSIAARRPGDPATLVASSDRIRRDLGWTPVRQDLDDIVSSAWQWMERHALTAP
jgi:UDP-glucose 4-epimerase